MLQFDTLPSLQPQSVNKIIIVPDNFFDYKLNFEIIFFRR